MLETRVLLLRVPVAGQPCPILDAESQVPLGFAQWRSTAERGWLNWWPGPVLAVHEQEEAPLVFTVRRRGLLWPWHEVRDAEDERIGSFSGSSIRDRNNLFYAQARLTNASIVVENGFGDVLATIRPLPEGRELTFTKLVEADPFAKMLLLAAALFPE